MMRPLSGLVVGSGFWLSLLTSIVVPVALAADPAPPPDAPEDQRQWRSGLVHQLQLKDSAGEASPSGSDRLPANCTLRAAGELGLAWCQNTNGLRLISLFDLRHGQELLATNSPPLFTLVFRRTGSTQEVRLNAEAGWRHTDLHPTPAGLELRWDRPLAPELTGIAVTATAILDASRHAVRWRFHVSNHNPQWGLWNVVFPQVALRDLGAGAAVLFPRGPGEVQRQVWDRAFSYHGNYPGGWCSMQFMAAYNSSKPPRGLYFAAHDPMGSVKDLILESDPASHSLRMRFDHPAPNQGIAGSAFELSGEAVWQLLRGDWFDAATIYRAWARDQARWWPPLTGAAGRQDSPLWMRELSVWVMGGGAPQDCVPTVKQFQQFIGLPTGFHWYNWHQIPFDNDYPHYFPTKTGFAAGVRELEQAGVRVMPYINGRLWDTHDRGADDFEFSRRAAPAATKDPHGQPWIETYGSKETNGNPVRLAVMCPTTPLWQQTVRKLVLRLLHDEGVSGVYIDQVAAAPPKLCMDSTHGHPLGGGYWWNEGYGDMLNTIRKAMSPNQMLTTECNGETFIRWFDGYLTWHWQYDGQVPAFPAVYGGTVQMFGRAYRGGATQDLALRMKAGQQFVFGEQIGWFNPNVIQENQNAEYLRQIVRLRWQLRRYFFGGEMARPPRLTGPIPTVKADWQWSGEWWVSTPAVLAGAWQIPQEQRLVLLFVNVSDQAVTAALDFDGSEYGLRASHFQCRLFNPGAGQPDQRTLSGQFRQPIAFPPRQAVAWELTW